MFYHFSEDRYNPDLVLKNTLHFTKTYFSNLTKKFIWIKFSIDTKCQPGLGENHPGKGTSDSIKLSIPSLSSMTIMCEIVFW